MKTAPDARQMDAYRQQMLEMYRLASSPAIPAEEENWLDERYPEPNIAQDKAAMAPPEEALIAPSSPPPPTETPSLAESPSVDSPTFVGYLRVFTFAGGGAEPIAGARAVITLPEETGETVYANLVTDQDGFTPVVALPTVDPALTLQPGGAKPYIAYSIRITADGFQSVEHRDIPVYGNNYVTLPVALIPLLPNGEERTQEFVSGGPANL